MAEGEQRGEQCLYAGVAEAQCRDTSIVDHGGPMQPVEDLGAELAADPRTATKRP